MEELFGLQICVDDYLTFLGSILEEEEFVKGDSSLESLNKWKA